MELHALAQIHDDGGRIEQLVGFGQSVGLDLGQPAIVQVQQGVEGGARLVVAGAGEVRVKPARELQRPEADDPTALEVDRRRRRRRRRGRLRRGRLVVVVVPTADEGGRPRGPKAQSRRLATQCAD